MIKEIRGTKYDYVDGKCYEPDHRGRIKANDDDEFVNETTARFWLE